MAFLRKRGKYWYIYYYDNLSRKTKAFSTKETKKSLAEEELKYFNANRKLNTLPKRFSFIPKVVSLEKATELFLETKNNRSEATRENYDNASKIFITICKNKEVGKYTTKDYDRFIERLEHEGYSPFSIQTYCRHLFVMFKYFVEENFIDHNIITKYDPRTTNVVKPIPFADLDVMRAKLTENKKWKHLMILNLAYYFALRRSEVIAIEVKDFDFKNKTFYVRNFKGKRVDEIPIISDAEKYVNGLELPKTGRLFYYSRPDSLKSFWRKLNEDCKFHYTLHQLRKTRGTFLANKGVEPLFLQQYMRHKDFKTTKKYYIKVDLNSARESINKKLS